MKSNLDKIRETLELDLNNRENDLLETPDELTDVQVASPSKIPLDPELEEDFRDQFTQHTFASNPLSKLALVGLGTFATVGLLVTLYSLTISPKETSVATENTIIESETFNEEEKSKQQKEDELLARLALSEQNRQLQANSPTQPKSVSNPKPPTEETASKHQEIKARQPTRRQEKRTQRPRSTSQRVTQSRPVSTQQQRTVPVRNVSSPNPTPNPQRTQQETENPEKTWQELAVLGSFGAKGNAEPLELPPLNNAGNYRNPSEETLIASEEGIYTDTLIEPQSIGGEIIGGLAVEGRSRGRRSRGGGEQVAIQLTEAVLDEEQVIVPEGAVIIAEAEFNGRIVKLYPISLSFDTEEGYQEIELDESAITVTGYEGPILAREKYIGGDQKVDWAGIGQTATAIGGLAGIDGGAELSILLGAANGNRNQRRREQPTQIFVLEEGTPVMVRFIRPTYLPVETPRTNTETTYELEFDQ